MYYALVKRFEKENFSKLAVCTAPAVALMDTVGTQAGSIRLALPRQLREK